MHLAMSCRNRMEQMYSQDEGESLFTGVFDPNHYGAVNSLSNEENAAYISERMRERLKWHYMNAYEKYKAGGRKPWKLLIQILKILLVTAQICWFQPLRFSVVLYLDQTHHVFHQLLFKDHQLLINNKEQAFYTMSDFYEQLNFTTFQYEHIEDIALGAYARPCGDNPAKCPVIMCISTYNNSVIRPSELFFNFSTKNLEKSCMAIKTVQNKSMQHFINTNRIPDDFHNVVDISLDLSLQTIKIDQLKFGSKPVCIKFKIKLNFHNQHHTGKFESSIEVSPTYVLCNASVSTITNDLFSSGKVIYDLVVIMVCFWSFVLTGRSFVRNVRLAKTTFRFFKVYKKEKLSFVSDGLELVNGWFILILFTDILTVVGSIVKICIDTKTLEKIYCYDVCSLCLGISILFIWMGILRYLGFLKKYNVLLITIEAAMPSVLRFLTCAGILYFGFLFCGWIVLGPYHPKFTTLSEVSECLFSLINGDDMFPTFQEMPENSYELWVFSKIYLYVFISLFIYIVLSLFIGIISDAYERLKSGQHILCSNVRRFIHGPECPCFVHSEMAVSSEGPSQNGRHTPETPST